MRRLTVGLAVFLTSVICMAAPAFGKLVLEDPIVNTADSNVAPGGNNVRAITFTNTDGSTNCVKYFEDGYTLSLKDAPFTSSVSGSTLTVYAWKANNGQMLNNHITVSSDLTISPVSTSAKWLKDTYYEEYATGASEVVNPNPNTNLDKVTADNKNTNAGLDNYFSLANNQYWYMSKWEKKKTGTIKDAKNAYSTTQLTVKGDNGASNPDDMPSLVKSYDSPGDYAYPRRNGTWNINYEGQYQTTNSNGDTVWTGGTLRGYTRNKASIGLETHNADYPNGVGNYNHYYKPINLSEISTISDDNGGVRATNQSEYCATRFVLNCDIVYTGQLTMGGLTGFVVTDRNKVPLDWTQLNYQGLMVGAYTEIDLNGYDLIIEGNSEKYENTSDWTPNQTYKTTVAKTGMLDCFGSITDSSPDRTGNLVLKDGSTFYTPLVFENMYREDAIPEAYFNGTDYMNMFRCPYLDCSLIVERGAKFYGKLFVSLGNSGHFTDDIGIVGPDSSFVLQLNSGKIQRVTYYNTELYDKIKTDYPSNWRDNVSMYNITYQRFRYIFQDADVVVNSFNIDMSMKFLSALNISFSFNSYKYQKVIPPYFDFYAYNSKITLQQEYIFMAGCYLYGDVNTQLIFAHGSYDIGNCTLDYADNHKNYHAGGINLATTYYPFTNGANSSTGWYDTRKAYGAGYDGYGQLVWQWNDFWNYYSKVPAKMDYFGTFSFNSGNSIPYVLAGFVNLRDNDTFLSSLNGVNINLYSSGATSGCNMTNILSYVGGLGDIIEGLDVKTIAARRTLGISAFYNSPLISNGEILTPLEGSGIYPGRNGSSLPQNIYYDVTSRLIYIGSNQAYAFLFDNDNPSNNVYWSNNTNLTGDRNANSLSGSFQKVTVNQTSAGGIYINYNGKDYISYQGGFMPFNPSGNTCSIMKLVGQEGKKPNADSADSAREVYRVMKLNSDKTWAISSKASAL